MRRKQRQCRLISHIPMSVDHYENFPVASVLCPPAIRPAVKAIYWFARTADDLADEGDASTTQRLADLAEYRISLNQAVAGDESSGRWGHVFSALQAAVRRYALPLKPFEDLLSAFEQDTVQDRYATRAELLDYCTRSANPIGRLLLHLYGVEDEESLQRSDLICTALQLINFWQDLSIDLPRGRIYLPHADCRTHAVEPAQLLARHEDTATMSLVREMANWARSLMLSGQPLVGSLPGRAGWELRFIIQGGMRILDKIDHLNGATLHSRPTLRWTDAPFLLMTSILMKKNSHVAAQKKSP